MQVIEKTAQNHPCFNEEAHDRVGRIHLPVAPRCNIQCNFCERKICMNLAIHHPGWTARVVSPKEARTLVSSIVSEKDTNFVIGVAGPGDPLANESTFETLKLIHSAFPEIMKCISTNGLLLEDKLEQLIEVGISALTVTVNAAEVGVGRRIYAWAKYDGRVYRDREAAELLLSKQVAGIKKAVAAGLLVKVNTVLIPGVNDQHVMAVASLMRNLGIRLMNIMPLIPSGRMKNLPAPTCDDLKRARRACELFVPQFCKCEHCRADTIHFPF